MFGAGLPNRSPPMTISPITFAYAPPITPIERVSRVRRRPKSQQRVEESADGAAPDAEPVYAAQSAEERLTDEARDTLIGMRLGG
jgi:hypothetical protein